MPHLIIEFSAGQASEAQIETMLDAVHQAVLHSGLFDEGHIRLRARRLEHYRLGGRREHFIHAQCRIHSGRDDEQKRQLSEAVLQALVAQQWAARSITVEVVELERASYAKFTPE